MQSQINQTEVQMVPQDTAHVAPDQAGKRLGVHGRTSRQILRAAIYRRLPVVFHLGVVAYTIALECRSSLLRIGSLAKQSGMYPVVDSEQVAGRDSAGHLIPCNRTQACTHDMQTLASRYPWATVQEVRVFVEAWKAGAEWGRSDEHRCSACSESSTPCKTSQMP
jgi:hypothetical protein